MLFNRRATIHACLLAVVALGSFPAVAAAQKVQKRSVPRAEAGPVTEAERDVELTAQQQRMDREMNREMLRIRESYTREALNRMRYGRERGLDGQRLLNELIPFSVFLAILLALLWILRVVLETRRWNKTAAVQAEMHKHLLEKFSSNQELLTYMESEAGRRFLEATPLQVEHPSRMPLPYGRILWSVQVGLILALAGAGMLFLQERVPDAAQVFLVFGTLTLAIGTGFLFSAIVSYILSKSFGLLEPVSRPASGPSHLTTGPQ